MKHRLTILGLSSILLCPVGHSATFMVSSASDISNALQSASPGDELVMTNGTWTDQYIRLNADGITLRAETPGQVILNGSSRLDISGDNLTVDGLHFKEGALSSGHVVRFTGSNGDATNSRFTNSAITDYNPRRHQHPLFLGFDVRQQQPRGP